MPPRTRPALSEDIARGIVRVKKRLIAEADRRLAERGEGVFAYQVLSVLQRGGPCAQNELAESLGQHPAGISRLLDDIEEARLVRRTRDAADRRRLVVAITARGRGLLARHRPLVDAAVEHVLAPLARSERQTLRDLLWRMLDA
jgi:DNA-binding MarR family transcriptional regulator